MKPSAERLVPLVERELAACAAAETQGDLEAAWTALNRAHVAAQPLVVVHTRVHMRMVRLAWRQRDIVELVLQVVLIPLAVIGSVTGIYPVGGGRFRSGREALVIPEDILVAIGARAQPTVPRSAR